MAVLLKDYIDQLLLTAQNDWQIDLARRWPEIVGDLHTKMSLEKIEGNVLKIGVYDSHWIHELFMLAPMIVRTINHKLGGNYLSSVRFGLKEKKTITRKRTQQVVIPQKKVILTAEQQRALQNIIDAELRVAMEKFLVRCLQS